MARRNPRPSQNPVTVPDNRESLSYVAGIVDGEGHLRINSTGGAELTITNTSAELMIWLLDEFQGKVREQKPPFDHPTWQERFDWHVYSANVEVILEAIRPYMVIKADQADVLLEFLSDPTIRSVDARDELLALRQVKRVDPDSFGPGAGKFQIPSLSTDLAYIAGIVDGEGTIRIVPTRRGGAGTPVYHVPALTITNTDLRLFEWLFTQVGCRIYKKSGREIETNRFGYEWRVFGKNAAALIQAIRPYLKVRTGQADLVLRMQRGRQGKRVDIESYLEHDDLVKRMHVLNRAVGG